MIGDGFSQVSKYASTIHYTVRIVLTFLPVCHKNGCLVCVLARYCLPPLYPVYPVFVLQGREQMHASLIELKKGLRQMSYKNSMITFKSFFALLNLKRRGLI